MPDQAILLEYISILTNTRSQLEFQVLQLTKRVKELEDASKQETANEGKSSS